MARTILIVDDLKMDRQILSCILSEEYTCLTAENGAEAMQILKRVGSSISAVLLDIDMPVMDGYAVLRAMREDAMFCQIPVLVATALTDEASREKAVALGADAFVEKPYSKTLLLHTLKNCVRLRETAAIANYTRFDELTGLLNRNSFFAQASVMISEKEAGYYVLSCFDINSFKVLNDQYGIEKGDEVLRFIGRTLQEGFAPYGGICCRIAADDFAVLYPQSVLDSDDLLKIHKKVASPDIALPRVSFGVGRYIVNDLTLTVGAMYDRAVLAMNSVKRGYSTGIALYDESMRLHLIKEREIAVQIHEALLSGQFEPWLQPQYNHETGALIGAEVLVRWRHPTRNIVPASEFIPILERNGFIFEIDRYIWEQTCSLLRKWIDAKAPLLPLSVNVSRFDLLHDAFFETITGFLEKYKLPVELLRLEVTESAFSEDTDMIVAMIKRLVAYGFTVEIDDFGSGYSSLNTLKDVPATVLKLDMKFLDSVEESRRGGSILESVIRMAKRLGMAVIAEGVETKIQADFLKSIGCNYMQGYLYAKPMPVAEYEELTKTHSQEQELDSISTIANLDNFSFWDPSSIDTLIFNSFVGGACIFEYSNGKPQLLRVNEKYQQVIGSSTMMIQDLLSLDFSAYITPDGAHRLVHDIQQSVETKKEVTGEYVFLDLPGCPHETRLRSTIRVIATMGNRYLVYCMSENVSQLYQAYANERAALLDNLPCGAGLYVLNDDGSVYSIYLNKRYRSYLRSEHSVLNQNKLFEFVHPDDLSRLQIALREIVLQNNVTSCDVRILGGDGNYILFHVVASIAERNGDVLTFCTTFTPISREELSYSEMLPVALAGVLGASTDMMYIKDRNLRYICCNRPFAVVNDFEDENDIIGLTDHDFAEKQFADQYRITDLEIIETKQAKLNFEAIIPNVEDALHYIITSKYPLMDATGRVIGIYGITRDVTKSHMADAQLKLLSDNIPGGIATFACSDKHIDTEHIRLTYFSDGYCRLLGYSREEYLKFNDKNTLKLVFSEDLPGLLKQLRKLLLNRVPMDFVFRTYIKDGTFRRINIKATAANRLGDIVTVNAILLDVTAQWEATEQLRISQEAYRLAMQHSGNMVCRYSVADRTLTVPPDVAAAYEMPEIHFNVPSHSVRDGYVAPESEQIYLAFFDEIFAGNKTGSAIFQVNSKTGPRWMEAHYATIFSHSGEPISAIISFMDITEQREREAVYVKWQQSLQQRPDESFSLFFMNLNSDTLLQPMQGSLLTTNPFDCDNTPFNRRTARFAREFVLPEDREAFITTMNYDTLLANYYSGKRMTTLDFRKVLPNDVRWLRRTIELVKFPDSSDIAAYILFEDIDESKRAELLTQTLAQTDPLTGLLNRKTFTEKMEQLLAEQAPDTLCALLMLDLDDFKQINDAFGHPGGDRVLVEVAEKLRSILRKEDLIGRLGGDEFVICMKNVPNRSVIGKKAKQICETQHKVFNESVRLSVSVGIAVTPGDGNAFDTLYKRADRACYHAKSLGKDNYVFYNEKIETAPLPIDKKGR